MTLSPEQLAMLQNAFTSPIPLFLPAAAPLAACSASSVSYNTGSLPLWPVLVAYPLFALLLAVASLVAPRSFLLVGLVASPALLLPLVVHALAVAYLPRPCQALACLCAALYPLAFWLAHPWLLWLTAFAFSCFFVLAAPRGVLGRASVWSCGLVFLSAALVLARAPVRLIWAGVILTLALQSVAATARLRYATLCCTVVDAMGRAPRVEMAYNTSCGGPA